MKRIKLIFTTLVATFICLNSYAELGMSARLQSNHLWRGGEVADGIVISSDATLKSLNDHLTLGIWGAMNTQGSYKEFDYFLNYKFRGFSLSLWDTYNFSDYATYNNEEFFNYKPSTTGRFLDATIAYQFNDKFPLLLRWSTILFGRDRDSSNSQNRYSTFCYAEYPIYKRGSWHVETGVGGAFTLNPQGESANFYGDKAGIVEISMVITNDLEIKGYCIPISFTTMWNPQADRAYMQIAAQLFSF